MKAIILAAGASTRLYPLTLSKPKALLPIAGRTILDQQIESLIAAHIDEVILVMGYKKEMIREHLIHKNYPIKITYVENDNYAHTGPIIGGLSLVQEHLHEPIIFSHCDVLFGVDAITRLISDPHESAVLYRKGDWDAEAGKIIVEDKTGRVQELGKHIEKERATGEYLQIAKFSKNFGEHLISVLDERIQTKRDGYTIDAFNDVVKDTSIIVTGILFDELIMEIDTPEDYALAQKMWDKR